MYLIKVIMYERIKMANTYLINLKLIFWGISNPTWWRLLYTTCVVCTKINIYVFIIL